MGSGGPGVIANSANDDFYIDKAAPALYVKVAGVWILIVSGGGVGGPTGPVGPTGPIGPTGVTGATGAVGVSGATGAAGPAGVTGVSGATGAVGPAGVTGATGVVGVSGATGAVGVSGATGAVGVTGATGAVGVTGATGAIGVSGATGAQGVYGGPITFPFTFSTALGGDPGAGGLRLANATQNTSTTTYISVTDGNSIDITAALATFDDSTTTIKGHWRVVHRTDPSKWILWQLTSTGDVTTFYILSGAVVASSAANPFTNGDPVLLQFERTGDLGATGPLGPPGIDGLDGTDGAVGAVGATGPQGVIGVSGATGAVGVSGATGAIGVSGATGPTGLTGVTGPMGMPGFDGEDGEPGIQGPIGPAPMGPWTAYTCTLTSSGTAPNIGATGFQTGRWMRIGRTVFMQFRINMSGAGFAAGTGNYSIALPVNADTTIATARCGIVTVGSTNDSGSCIMLYVSTATTFQGIYSATYASGVGTTWGAGNPVALATGCNLFGWATYEAAAD